MIRADACIIGHGLAGGLTALLCADAGLKVALLTADPQLTRTNTYMAQGGIVYDRIQSDQDRRLFVEDVLAAGAGCCYRPAVEKLAALGARYVDEYLVKRLEINFDHARDGSVDLILEAAHSKPRVAHFQDRTGRQIQDRLNHALCAHDNIRMLAGLTAIDLLTSSHHAVRVEDRFGPTEILGAHAFNQATGEVCTVCSDVTVLASGGLGQIYQHTTNPRYSRGDGVAMAYRAGARVANMEYVQFHPSAFFFKGKPRFLVSEAIRGYGGVLRNARHEAFMAAYHPQKDLAPRDVVSRSIYKEMALSRSPSVYLDMTHLPAADIRARFPYIEKACGEYGFDLTKDLIPVVPAAHYHCGGVWVDLAGRTSLDRLYAVGEVSCTGVHGANRLASTSLLECLVWGGQAAGDIVERLKGGRPRNIQVAPWRISPTPIDLELVAQDWQTLQQTMLNYVGVVRTRKRLQRAAEILPSLKEQVEQFYRESQLSDEIIGLRNAVLTAMLVFDAARRNTQSRGCHYHED